MSAKPKNNHSRGQEPSRTGVALMANFFKEQMEQTETITVGGRRKTLSRLEITVIQLRNRAIAGNERAVRSLMALLKKAEKWRKIRPKRQILLLVGADAYL